MARRPPHLALNPPYFVLIVLSFCVFSLFGGFLLFAFLFPVLFLKEKPVFPPKKGYFCLVFSVSLCFSLVFFPPPFLLSLPCLPCSSLPSLFSFLLLFASVFLSLFAFVSWKEQHQHIKSEGVSHQSFLFLGSCLLLSFKSLFSYLCFFPDFKMCCLVKIYVCFIFQKDNL